ncbi:MAG: histidine kinase [Acidobacteriota bacterium]
MQSLDFRDKLPSFWTIQLVGWIVYFVVIYITFLTIALPENYLNLFYLKAFRALTGFFLTSIFLRQIYHLLENRLSIGWLILLVLICASVFGYAWTGIEFYYAYLTNPILNLNNYLARSPRIALDYATTLIGWSALYLGVKNWLAWQKERENALQANFLADKAQLEVLRYQLNPHFLFNALNSIRASVDEDQNRAKRMITQLSEFLRHSLLSAEKKEIPLQEELEAVKNYLAIEKIRFEEKLEVEYDVDVKAEDFSVPCLLLNPLVENAVKHGFLTSPKPLKIKITAKLEVKKLTIEVANTGKLNDLHNSNGTKIGLKNVRERLEKLYGDKSSFEIKQVGEIVRARIQISKI